MSKQETVCAIVVTYNRLDLLKQGITALRGQSRSLDRIIVVNNGSSDLTEAWLKEQVDIEWITQENVGCAGGFATGIKAAFEKGYDWLWCMDDDVVVSSNCLEELLRAGEALPEAGILAPVRTTPGGCLYGHEKIELNFSNPLRPYGFPRLHERYPSLDALGNVPVRVEGITFEGPLVKAAAMERIGMPREDLFIFADDADFSARAKAVCPIFMVPKARLTRLLEEPDGKKASWKDYYYVRNLALLDIRFGNIFVKMLRPAKFTLAFLVGRIWRDKHENPLLLIRASMKGLAHAYLGFVGKRH